jgi:hypothetical protein
LIKDETERKEKKMKTRTLMIAVIALMLVTGSALAQMMGGGHMGGGSGYMGPGPGPYPGPNPGPNPGPGWDHMGYGRGYGMRGVGGMGSMMYGNTISHGYLDKLNPIADVTEAQAVIQAFIDTSNSSLQISELWEYGTAYKAELSDTNGTKAFDLIADKFTGAVMPEMGYSMMSNASYGRYLYKTRPFRKNLSISPDQAAVIAQTFVDNNSLGYTLGTPEIYPGYYKFHTTNAGSPRMDIMVNGYHGGVWMNTFLGVPLRQY